MNKATDTNAHNFLSQASNAISDRGAHYGDPRINLVRTANLIKAAGLDFSNASHLPIALTLVKISRIVESANHKDSYVDAIAYLALAGQLQFTDWDNFDTF